MLFGGRLGMEDRYIENKEERVCESMNEKKET
jgi:hypothetical protein